MNEGPEEVVTVPVSRLLRLLSEHLASKRAHEIVAALQAPRPTRPKPSPEAHERAYDLRRRKGRV